MTKQKGLGRGLDALLSGNGNADFAEESLQSLEIAKLQPGKYQPRTNMDQVALAELAESIKAQGVMQPILVRPVNADQYEIIAGERRWRAAQLAGLTEVPALIRKVADESALAMSLIENIQRENLNPLEEAMGIQRLINEFGMTHQTAGEALGNSRSTISNLLRLLNLSAPVQELMMQGKIDMGHGRALLSLAPVQQIKIANVIVQKQLSVRETEKIVNQIEHPALKQVKKPDRDLLRLQEDVSERLGAQVAIKPKKNGQGNIVIHYTSLDQLDDILSKL
ncbi:MAG: ParB/RepB/Spo0J family partition protein [Nitrosomonas sp.]|jgi:ParB family chromosome partitioning protein|uniref:ParB/RepB/Spo0J family partition protein n=1 Tax=Nitrosomonas sp. TaxID=42353 RepID=UPI00271DC6CE|nr:ParB/RepB/Spo0J family partition protein [Nitrosomonas sp.]MDO8893958.1 ParB/RepB/Spo0J family partition protein [Nitrosomonas sp.]MDO9471039.1 ParB/RepB/Spo0J family partition protein [Nitrosomonas sp.]MDP1549216.1 ParB/RepB/Spo0J family partition protein [Nitrosomonas sp.]MDP1785740.1 ParB/RepB/Spo0J family partition protein [Nitrosomonas sp.]MDP1935018.1 ParB/RepB/Spo0J family partition protein [Nitrosomonas sp.]